VGNIENTISVYPYSDSPAFENRICGTLLTIGNVDGTIVDTHVDPAVLFAVLEKIIFGQ
jgi:hypothetical protein